MINVYSGDCRICEVGIDTELKSGNGEPLKTGDIVMIYTEHYHPSSLTVVLARQYQSYSNAPDELLPEPHEKYIMGIASVDLDDNEWTVTKVKDHSEVVDGEHWKAYGFSYREIED